MKRRADMKWINYTGKIYYEFKLQGPSLAQVSSKVLPGYDKFRSVVIFFNGKFGSNLIWFEKKNLKKNTMSMGLCTKDILVFVSFFK